MKKKIAILGSTGSIGKSILNIVSKNKKSFHVTLLTANKNYHELIKQAKLYNVKNLILKDEKSFHIAKNKIKDNKIKIYNNFGQFNEIFKKKKIDYVMSSIVGIDGLYPTFKIIKYTKKIAIANKESIICAWNLINKELKKNNTQFVPVDSEHFSIWYGNGKKLVNNIKKIHLTASGGSLLNIPINQIDKLSLKKILKHPKWSMGHKITVDSSTLMNKVFEIIETKKIFNINYKNINVVIHPDSYVHAIIEFSNGMIKLVAHNTTMTIPIANTIYGDNYKIKKNEPINFKKLNNLNFTLVDLKKFPLIQIVKKLPEKESLFETVLVSTNDELVDLYLKQKIKYKDLRLNLAKIVDNKEFNKYKKIVPRKISDVIKLSDYIRLKTRDLLS